MSEISEKKPCSECGGMGTGGRVSEAEIIDGAAPGDGPCPSCKGTGENDILDRLGGLEIQLRNASFGDQTLDILKDARAEIERLRAEVGNLKWHPDLQYGPQTGGMYHRWRSGDPAQTGA